MKYLFVILLLMTSVCLVHAADEPFDDPRKQARYENLIHELRCLVCQNQTIADSNADLALDLRARVAELIAAGYTDAEVIAFLTDRYGDFVLYRPPMQANTVLLWAGPFLLLLAALGVLFVTVRHRARLPESDEEPE